MTGCDIIIRWVQAYEDLVDNLYTPEQRLRLAYEMRTQQRFYEVIKKSYNYGHTTHRGMLLYILRYHFRTPHKDLQSLTGYLCLQPAIRAMELFQSELNVNPELKRIYNDICTMLSIN